MPNDNDKKVNSWRLQKVFQYFLQGLLVTAPLAITIYLIYKFVSSVDSWIPIFTEKDVAGNVINRNYGSGFIMIIVTLIVIGYLSSNFITSRIFNLFDSWLERTPGIKFIYSSIKDFFEAFAGNKRKFNKAVLINIHSADVWQIGFITAENAIEFGLKDYITVYVPMSYSFAGMTYIVPVSKVRKIEHISAGDALKYTVSGGIAEIEDEENRSRSKNVNVTVP
ncbi:MAG: DUF502 domain-containing protein [Chitinophagaceae bacterium]